MSFLEKLAKSVIDNPVLTGPPPLVILPLKTLEDSKGESEEKKEGGISKGEVSRIKRLIRSGKDQGLSEMYIKVSSGVAEKIAVEGGALIESIPLNVKMELENDSKGECFIHVKYLEVKGIEKLKELKLLYDNGTLTESEFLEAKKKAIESI